MNATNDIQATVEYVTPEFARRVVERENLAGSKMGSKDRKSLRLYQSDIVSGRWKLNGDAIIFASDDSLIDGRKRLLAAAETGIGFPSVVVTGVDADAKTVIDQHKRRSSRDPLQIAGYDKAGPLSSMANAMVNIARTGLSRGQALSHTGMLRMVRENSGIAATLADMKDHNVAEYITLPDLAALVYLMRYMDGIKAVLFMRELGILLTRLEAGGQVEVKRPLELLAVSLFNLVTTARRTGGSNSKTRALKVAYVIEAWNATQARKEIKRFRYKADEDCVPPRFASIAPGMFDRYRAPEETPGSEVDYASKYRLMAVQSQIKVDVMLVTPQWAETTLLENGPATAEQVQNRKLTRPIAESYARLMSAGLWMLSGQTIKIAEAGWLADGQHRLRACIISGVPFYSIVVRDVGNDVFDTFDVGDQHTLAKLLSARNEGNGATIQGALRVLFQYERVGLTDTKASAGILELIDLLDNRYPQVREHAANARKSKFSHLGLNSSKLAAAMTIMHEMDPEVSKTFFEKVETGINIVTIDDPALRLTKKLIAIKGTRGKAGTSAGWLNIYLLCMAWNAARAGKPVTFGHDMTGLKAPAPFDRPPQRVVPVTKGSTRRAPKPSAPLVKMVGAIEPGPAGWIKMPRD